MKRLSVIILLAILLTIGVGGSAGADTYPPGLMFSTLLNGVKMDYKTGEMYLDKVQAVFLPTPASTAYYPYNPTDGDELYAVIYDTGRNEIGRFDFYASVLNEPYWLLNSYELTDMRSGEKPANGRIKLGKGDYNLDFFTAGRHIYNYPFSVDTIASSDPFTPGDYYFLEGDWSDYGYFYYRDANPENALQWKIWFRNKEHEPYKDVKIRVEVKRGGSLVCTSRESTTYSLTPDWVRYELDMIFPMEETSGGAYFKAKDLLNTDGDYTMTIKIGDEAYGTWNFKVSGGQFVLKDRARRDTADPLTFVEGGRDAFWYGKD